MQMEANNMKVHFLHRLFSLSMVFTLLLALSTSAFASDSIAKSQSEANVIESQSSEQQIMPRNNICYMTVGKFGASNTCTLILDSYIGFTKEFYVGTTCSSNDGILIVQLIRKSDGKVLSNDWYVSPNDSKTWKFTLPTSGEYTVTVSSNGTTDDVRVKTCWL